MDGRFHASVCMNTSILHMIPQGTDIDNLAPSLFSSAGDYRDAEVYAAFTQLHYILMLKVEGSGRT